jgi:N-hydroxyarylamine O-acetyltransferase
MRLNELEVRLYLTRIGVEQSFKLCELPSIERLNDLHRCHLTRIPFENLSIALGEPMKFADKHAFEKIVADSRGGFCYELNYAFYQLLCSLRFDVSLINARVYNRERDCYGQPFDHLALLVNIVGKKYLVDVGFGDSFSMPVSLNGRTSKEGDCEYQVTRENKTYFLHQRKTKGKWFPLYQFTIEPQLIEAFESMFHYHQNNEASSFTQKSVCTRLTEHGRVTFANGKLTRHEFGEKHEIYISKAEQLRRLFSKEFGLYFPNEQCLYSLLNNEIVGQC